MNTRDLNMSIGGLVVGLLAFLVLALEVVLPGDYDLVAAHVAVQPLIVLHPLGLVLRIASSAWMTA